MNLFFSLFCGFIFCELCQGGRERQGGREGVVIFVVVVAEILVVWAREGGRKEGSGEVVKVVAMASTAGLVPITRAFLSKFYDKYPFQPLTSDVSLLTNACKEQALRILAANPDDTGNQLYLCHTTLLLQTDSAFVHFLFLMTDYRGKLGSHFIMSLKLVYLVGHPDCHFVSWILANFYSLHSRASTRVKS